MNIAKMIDHTALKPETTKEMIVKLCQEAKEYQFASVCVNPYWVQLSSNELKGTGIDVCTVIGFPLGANTSETKAFETKNAIANGATEVDMVINVGALKSGDLDTVEADIRAVVEASGDVLVKVILETCLLTKEEIVKVSELSVKAGADFVKTSTGFSTGGATAEDIALMRKTVGPDNGVKASGGVRTKEDVMVMIEAGASRIGASAGVSIVSGNNDEQGNGY